MPGVDGIELAIRTRQERTPVRVIAMSGGGHLDKGDVLDLARRLGVAHTLAKPFRGEELLAAVRKVLDQPT